MPTLKAPNGQTEYSTAQPARRGAPPLPSTEWLQAQIELLPAACTRPNHLYKPWLARYEQFRGFLPVDPRRGFRAAVQGCLRRLERTP